MGDDLKKAVMNGYSASKSSQPRSSWPIFSWVALANLGGTLADGQQREGWGLPRPTRLTGREPPKGPKQKLMYPKLKSKSGGGGQGQAETPILVILGNPPYNGFAGMAVDEERELSNHINPPNEPNPARARAQRSLVRFYRMAERRIIERRGQGIMCFI